MQKPVSSRIVDTDRLRIYRLFYSISSDKNGDLWLLSELLTSKESILLFSSEALDSSGLKVGIDLLCEWN